MYSGDLRFFPLVLQRMSGAMTDATLDALRTSYAEVHARQQPFVALMDSRGSVRPNSVMRAKLADYVKETLPQAKLFMVASAVVVDHPLIAGVMTAVRWAVPSPRPEKYHWSSTAALDWLEPLARERGITITADMRAHLAAIDGT